MRRSGISGSEGPASFVEARYGSRILTGQQDQGRPKARFKACIKKLLAGLGVYEYVPRQIKTIETITLDRLVERVGKPVDLLQMDVQGLELDVLGSGSRSLDEGSIKTFLIGTHSQTLHPDCVDFLIQRKYWIELEDGITKEQPDGIIVASKGAKRLAPR